MARLSKGQLLARVDASLREDGWNVLMLSPPNEHPGRFRIFRDGERHTLRVYIWNISHGGGAARPAHEYRIQITGIDQFQPEPNGKTLILGWYDELGVFAAFDYDFHKAALGASPSIQISEGALAAAAANGLAPYNRGNGELAIAVRPDVLGLYVQNMEDLHETGAIAAETEVLTRLGQDPAEVEPAEIEDAVARPRRRALLTTLRLLRDVRFRGRVMAAYGHRCAFCGVQLNLLDAAHVLPVGHPESTDNVNNGVALCALHHRAYDRALVTFDSDYQIVVSEPAIEELKEEDHARGLKKFRAALRVDMLLPTAPAQRPSPALLTIANELRGWP